MLEPMDKADVVKPYMSKDGYVKANVLRGGYEIEMLYLEMSKIGGLICGGYVRWMCSQADQPVPPGDIDVYFPSEKDYERAKALFTNKYGLSVKHENAVSLTFAKPPVGNALRGCRDIQLIKPINEGNVNTIHTGIEDVLNNFDFTVVRAGLLNPRLALIDADFDHDEPRKILRLKNIHCPVGSTLRCMKYSRKGYWLPPTQALKLFFDWDQRPDEYINRLVEFVTKANDGEGLTRKEIDEMEAMMRID